MDIKSVSTDVAQRRSRDELERMVERIWPGGRVLEVVTLAPDATPDVPVDEGTHKGAGYGVPLKVRLRLGDGSHRTVVFHLMTANTFGHDRRADRAQCQLLAYDTFNTLPSHVRALEVGAVLSDGRLLPLSDSGELYLVTSYAEGAPYAEDLRRVVRERKLGPSDLSRVDALARYLVALHHRRLQGPNIYRRSVRDLLGSGEGICGIVDGYPPNTPGASEERLQQIERACLKWRWRLRKQESRLRTIHGDFHPFNVVFGEGDAFTLLDASRGCAGDPADDVTAMAINFVFFSLEHPGAWQGGLRTLWYHFWQTYLSASEDRLLLEVAAPFLAWRALVVANPAFYPAFPEAARDRILGLGERALASPRFDPAWADDLFR